MPLNQNDNSLRNNGAVDHFTKIGCTWEESSFLKSPSGDDIGSAVAQSGSAAVVGGSNEFITFIPNTTCTFTELQRDVYSPDLETPSARATAFVWSSAIR